MSYSHIIPYLFRGSLVQLRKLGPPPTVLPPGYDANARCEFHSGTPGHSIKNYKALKYKVQDLIDSKAITFTPKGLNVNNNPMPPHNNSAMNMMEVDNGRRLISYVDELKTLLIEIKNALMKDNSFPVCVPTPFPYINTKAVPWVYDTSIYIHGQKLQEEPLKSSDPMINITGTGEITRNGRIFAPTPTSIGAINPSTSDKGKQIDGAQQRQDPAPSNEVDELLRIIKKSDYLVVDQLNQTPSKISMLSLLMCSEADKDALVKFLRTAHVPQDISVCEFEGVVNNIVTSLSLGFGDEELPAEGRNHNKALHIFIECVDTVLSRVFVDTGSSVNVMPKSSFAKLTVEGLVMKPSELIVRAFDGTRRTVIGEVNLHMNISPHTFFITFFVMHIYSAYSCLLGRPWIHSVGAVTSTLHQKLKFLADDKLVIVEGEEDIMDESKDDESLMASLKDALTIIKDGHPQGWGRLFELPANKDRTGLGYNSQNLKKPTPIATRGSVLPLSKNFSSASYLDDNSICAVEGDEEEDVGLIFTEANGKGATKWTEIEIPKVTLIKM
ncbi:uncharacterized protein LOC127136591 [Lathyrus oleraceus]|uniref:uncharacterized protein LOC127136591 n=1 Tax=Pisum sativum TaxID=3888 RepID=UPI0021D09124|nr:uncharacterized protein LOC127136591 [Pisum sativum]